MATDDRAQAPAALIYAGGRGTRLSGAVKANLLWRGRRYLELAADRLAGCAPLLVAVGPYSADQLPIPAGALPVSDIGFAGSGPVAALAGAIQFLRGMPAAPEFLLTAAVDTPLLPADFVARLRDGVGAAPAAFAISGGQLHPTHALWRIAALSDLPERLQGRDRVPALHSLVAAPAIVSWPATSRFDPFHNINTPEDLALLAAHGR